MSSKAKKQKTMIKLLGIILLFVLFFLCGNHILKKQLVKEYIRSISPHSFVIQSKKDNTWEIYFVDKPNYTFEVWFEWRRGLFELIPKRKMESNYNGMFSFYYYNEYKESNKTRLICTNYSYNDDVRIYGLAGDFSTAEEATMLAHDIVKYFDYVQKQKYLFAIFESKGGGYMQGSRIHRTSVNIICDFKPPVIINEMDTILYYNREEIRYIDYIEEHYNINDIEEKLMQYVKCHENKVKYHNEKKQ